MSRIEQLISDMEAYIDSCKYVRFSSNKIAVDKEQIEDMLAELRLRTPEEVKKYQRILSNTDAIIADAKEKADAIINQAQIETSELIDQHEIMQQAYEKANKMIEEATVQAQNILDAATNDANEIRLGAIQYTDDMLEKLQYIIEHSIKDNRNKYNSLMSGLENILNVVNNNRNELKADEQQEEQAEQEQQSDNNEQINNIQENNDNSVTYEKEITVDPEYEYDNYDEQQTEDDSDYDFSNEE